MVSERASCGSRSRRPICGRARSLRSSGRRRASCTTKARALLTRWPERRCFEARRSAGKSSARSVAPNEARVVCARVRNLLFVPVLAKGVTVSDKVKSASDLMTLMSREVASDPQHVYELLLADGPAIDVDDLPVVVATSRAAVENVLRDSEAFSSGMAATDLKTRRPLIPMSIDPPAHRTYRKLLNPLFSQQRMKLLKEPVTALANELIDSFIDDDEIDFTKQ